MSPTSGGNKLRLGWGDAFRSLLGRSLQTLVDTKANLNQEDRRDDCHQDTNIQGTSKDCQG